jgi:phosphate transport system substrate-binding protein
MYPAVAAAVVPIINIRALAERDLALVLDRSTLPRIFLGDIHTWTDPDILSIQDADVAAVLMNLTDPTITPIMRDDGSGTSEIFTTALSRFSDDFASRIGAGSVRQPRLPAPLAVRQPLEPVHDVMAPLAPIAPRAGA